MSSSVIPPSKVSEDEVSKLEVHAEVHAVSRGRRLRARGARCVYAGLLSFEVRLHPEAIELPLVCD